ncbi:protein strawberry notch [Musca domestica]|uniref:Protein strawberry notch n=1 Tax=Musca domestica TaxID=7370 RepID=A0A1I8MJB7_MUSDO|nr:protein strawberry notch [Musca domestica]
MPITKRCCVPGCHWGKGPKATTYHAVKPSWKVMLQKRYGLHDKEARFICSIHFPEYCMYTVGTRKLLFKDSEPSLYLPEPTKSLTEEKNQLVPAAPTSVSTTLSTSPESKNTVMDKIQALLASNPEYLAKGIPNHILEELQQQKRPKKEVSPPATVLIEIADDSDCETISVDESPVLSPPPENVADFEGTTVLCPRQGSEAECKDFPVLSPAAQEDETECTEASVLSHTLEEDEADNEKIPFDETYVEYRPRKFKLGKKHPNAVVETTSLSAVELCDIDYELSIPLETIQSGQLSNLQLESIAYVSQAHDQFLPNENRAGFLLGDGVGVGKGRTIAGLIYENYLKGRHKAIWLSVSNNLKYDAERDFKDIGATDIQIYPLTMFKCGQKDSEINNIDRCVVFGTYSDLLSSDKYKSRLQQLLQWCGQDFEGLIIFDECRGGFSEKLTKALLELQNELPRARVVYSSSVLGGLEAKTMSYMIRLGVWGQGTEFPRFTDFLKAMDRRGLGAMKIMAMELKRKGRYIARQLSFNGVSFRTEEVPLSQEFTRVYEESCGLWFEARQKFHEASQLLAIESALKTSMWNEFWSAHQRYFKSLYLASKLQHVIPIAREAIRNGKCVVITLPSMAESDTSKQMDGADNEFPDFPLTTKGIFQSLVEKYFSESEPQSCKSTIETLIAELKAENSPRNDNFSSLSSAPSNKRKSVTPEAVKNKKSRMDCWEINSSDYNEADEDGNDSVCNMESNNNSNEWQTECEYSDSDLNLFEGNVSGAVSDSWLVRASKKKKKKKMAKKSAASVSETSMAMKPCISPHLSLTTNQNSQSSTQSHCFNLSETQEKDSNSIPDKIQDLLPKKQQAIEATKYGSSLEDVIERVRCIKEDLLQKIKLLEERLPVICLDQLIDELGGREHVSVITGSNDRWPPFKDDVNDGNPNLSSLNIEERQHFMDGSKNVAIISESAFRGMSLQSDRRESNQRTRVHILLDLPPSVDRTIHNLGPTHRSNQANPPEYIFLVSDLASEKHFAETMAKRLESLGALRHIDPENIPDPCHLHFSVDNKYGHQALESTVQTIMGYEQVLVPSPQNHDYHGELFRDIANGLKGVGLTGPQQTTPNQLSLDKLFNRIMGMPMDLQNRLFKYFCNTLKANVKKDRRHFDLGILYLGASGEEVSPVKVLRFMRKNATGRETTELHTVRVERGMMWREATEKYADLVGDRDGFYLSHQEYNSRRSVILAVELESQAQHQKLQGKEEKDMLFQIYRPNTGRQSNPLTWAEIEKKYKRVTISEVESHWTQQYEAAENICSHLYWNGNCRNENIPEEGAKCEIGLRQRLYQVMAGSVWPVWSRVEQILAVHNDYSRMQIVHIQTTEGEQIVGVLVPESCCQLLIQDLKTDANRVEEINFLK